MDIGRRIFLLLLAAGASAAGVFRHRPYIVNALHWESVSPS